MKLIKNDCGRHWGKGGRCAKCASGVISARHARNQNLVAALEPIPQSLQERGIEAANGGHWFSPIVNHQS